jgi:hypothetical protein
MTEGTSVIAGTPSAATAVGRVRKPSIAGVTALSIVLLVLGAGNVIASASQVMDPYGTRYLPWSFVALVIAGLAGFVVLVARLAAVRRGAAAPDRKLLAAPGAVLALAAACALGFSTSASTSDRTWLRLAVLAPGAAWASVLLAVAAGGLAFVMLKRSATRVFDERGVTALL